MRLDHKVALVTGGTKGIGAATAIALAQGGADVALVARTMDQEAHQTAAQFKDLGRRCVLIAGDMARPADATACVATTVKELGGLDVLVHAAGGAVGGGLLDLTEDAWMNAFNVHVHAVFHLVRAAMPFMKTRGEGSIILISSAAGIRGVRTAIAYQVVKGALPQMTRALAFEFAPANIRVNCVAPGVIRTAFHAAMPESVKQNNIENRIPLKREGTPQQVASIIRELVTNDFMTGETISIDGGMTMRIC